MEKVYAGHNKASVFNVEGLGVLCWLLKDFGWCLLLGPVSWPMACFAIVLESRELLTNFVHMSKAEFVHTAALLIWLIANAVWMTSELLWLPSPERGRYFPWFHGPYAGENEAASDSLLFVAQCILIGGMVMLLAFYGTCIAEFFNHQESNPQDQDESPNSVGPNSEPLVFGWITPDVYVISFVGFWMLKDLCWTFDLLYPALACAFIVTAMVCDYMRRFGAKYLAEFFWVMGNTTWIFAELQEDDSKYWPRLCAACWLGAGIVVTVLGMYGVAPFAAKETSGPTEKTGLLAH